MGIPFDKNKTDKPEYPTPPIGEQVHVYIGQGENKNSKAGNKMLVLNCTVMDDSEGAGFDFKEYLVEGSYFNYKAACIMNAAGIDIDSVQEVDDMTFRGFDAAVVFKNEPWTDKDGKERNSIKLDQWVPRSQATIELAPAPQQPNNVQVKNPEPEYEEKLPF